MTIAQRLDAIERKRTRLMELVSEMDAHVAAARARPEQWSVQEIVEHLVLAERSVFGHLEALDQQRPASRGLKDRVLYLVVMFILRFDIPVQVPSPAMRPTGGVSLSTLWEQWASNHARLRAWAVSADGLTLAQPLFAHPVAGPMSMQEALRMLEVHLDRHTRQIVARGRSRRS